MTAPCGTRTDWSAGIHVTGSVCLFGVFGVFGQNIFDHLQKRI